MKKLSVYFTALAVTLCVAYSSCKKTTHDTNPTPKNIRLLSYTKTISQGHALPTAGYTVRPTVLETYTFSYDNSNRVSQIIYTTNDADEYMANLQNLTMTFNYTGNTVIKTITKPDNSVVEVDSFMVNSDGLVTNAYTPTLDNYYEYYGKLMIRNTITGHAKYPPFPDVSTATTVSSITSSKGNFLQLTYDDNVNMKFGNMNPSTIKLYFDYLHTTRAGLTNTQSSKDNGTSTSYTLSGYSREPITVMCVDTLHDTALTIYPGLIWPTEDYTFYGDNNRVGDYFQLQSFTKYGANIYNNSNLVKSIKNSGYTTNVTYTIDAQSEISQTNVSIVDSLGTPTSLVYKLAYQTY